MTDSTEIKLTQSEEVIKTSAPNWYQTWRDRIHTWIQENSDDLIADIVLFVPDMFMLTVRLIKDKRVPFLVKAQLILSAAYVLSPFDLVPEGLSGVIGLVDDAGVLALTLYWVRNIINIDPKILKDNWVGENDLNDVIQQVHERVNDNANKLFSGETWNALRSKFDRSYKSTEQMGDNKVPIDID